MAFISLFRTTALCLSLLFGLVVLGLTAKWTQASIALQGVVALLAGALTLLTLPVLLVLAAVRKGAFTSMIAVELPILAVLWILWLIAAALTADLSGAFYPFGCDTFGDSLAFCRQFMAIEALSFLIWLLLILYTITLLTYTLIAQSRGNNVWKLSVAEAVFFPQNATNEVAATQPAYSLAGAPTPMAQQYQYPPGSVPMQQAAMPIQGQYTPYITQPNSTLVNYPASNTHSAYPQV